MEIRQRHDGTGRSPCLLRGVAGANRRRHALGVSATEPIRFVHRQPVPNDDHAALLSSYHLLLQQAKEVSSVSVRSVPSTTVFESWEVTRAAFVARMAGTLRHLGYLAPSYSRLDGYALARTLVDHAITFAWISGDPKERLPTFIKASFESFIRKDDEAIGRGDGLLDEETRKGFQAFINAHPTTVQPKLWRRADQADESWAEKVTAMLPDSLQIVGFRVLYDKIYAHYATTDHATTLGLQPFVHVAGTPKTTSVDGETERDLVEDLRPYWIAMFAFSEALIVSHLASGRPRIGPLRKTMDLIGNIRLMDRDGRLSVATTAKGTTISASTTEPHDNPGPPPAR
jgi:hypothetical protein